MDDQIMDDLDEEVPELQAYFERLFSRWQETLKRGRRRRGPEPSQNKFWEYLRVPAVTGNTWLSGARTTMSLRYCVEIATRIWEIDLQGGIFRAKDAEELFRINGFDPVAPVRDARLRQIVLDWWDKLDYEDREELANYAERLAAKHTGESDAARHGRNEPENLGRSYADTVESVAEFDGGEQVEGLAQGVSPAQLPQESRIYPE